MSKNILVINGYLIIGAFMSKNILVSSNYLIIDEQNIVGIYKKIKINIILSKKFCKQFKSIY